VPLATPRGLAIRGELRHTSVVKKSVEEAGIAVDDPRTRDLVARSILEHGPTTATLLAERLGFTPAGIRRHLDALLADGLLEAREPRSFARRGRGRPSKVFMMTDNGREKFEHSYDDLAVSALKFMAEQLGETSLKAFAAARSDEIEKTLTPVIAGSKNSAERARALADYLSVEGYAASVEPRRHGEEICQHHCPIAHVASQFPQLCEAETEAFSRLLGTHVQRLATIAHGDGVCTTYIPNVSTSPLEHLTSTTGGN
jgi:predicted ArsR family transcriptional regulator